MVDYVAARDELTTALDQQDQQVHRLSAKFHRTTETAQRVRSHIQLEVTESEGLTRTGGLHCGGRGLLECHKSSFGCYLQSQENSMLL